MDPGHCCWKAPPLGPCLQESPQKRVDRRTASASFSYLQIFNNASRRGNDIHIQNSAVSKSKKCRSASQDLHARRGWDEIEQTNPQYLLQQFLSVFIQDVGTNKVQNYVAHPRRCSPDGSDGSNFSNLPRVMVITGSWDLNPVLSPITNTPLLPFNFFH